MTPEENDLLCRVEGDAPMGQLARRHWNPVCLSEEVAEPDGTPLRARLLGEDLVVFRDSAGRLGVLGEYCPHRGASLVYGRNEEGGLRCLYHGWKFDVEGRALEMSSEPSASRLADHVMHVAYPVREAGGMVWIYMGPPETMPPFQRPAWAPNERCKVSIVKMHVAANWAQTLEGGIDSAHSSSLHSTEMPSAQVSRAEANEKVWLRPSADKAPRLQVERTGYGFRYAAIRRPIEKAETHDYVRITVYIAPFTALIPPNDQYNVAQMNVPIDDTNTWFYFIAWADPAENRGPGIDQAEWRRFCAAQPGVDLDANWRKLRNRDNHYQQDRAAMKAGDFTGIKGIPTQDMAMWESMGVIRPRTGDRLGASDVAIGQFRRQMADAARRFRETGEVIGRVEPVSYASLKSFEGVVPKSADWRSFGVSEPEPAGAG
jgi:phthalate 4,5-dioxygenase oxygenase subunit